MAQGACQFIFSVKCQLGSGFDFGASASQAAGRTERAQAKESLGSCQLETN